MARAVFLLLLATTVASADKNLYPKWIAQLRGPDAQRAHRSLLRAGTYALKELRRAAHDASSPEAAALAPLAKKLIADIEKREPHGLLFSAGMPKMALTVATVNSGAFKYAVRVKNKTGRKVKIWPFLRLRLLDAAGNEVKRSQRLGRAGLAGRPPQPVTIEPYEIWSFQDSLKRYMHDPDWITGWKIAAPGNYTLEFTYHFDAAAARKRWGPKGADGDSILAFKHTFTTEMHVR